MEHATGQLTKPIWTSGLRENFETFSDGPEAFAAGAMQDSREIVAFSDGLSSTIFEHRARPM